MKYKIAYQSISGTHRHLLLRIRVQKDPFNCRTDVSNLYSILNHMVAHELNFC